MPSGDQTRWLSAYWSKYGSTWFTNSADSETIAGVVAAPAGDVDELQRDVHAGGVRDGEPAAGSTRVPRRGGPWPVDRPTVAAGGVTVLGMPSVAIVLPSGDQKNADDVLDGQRRGRRPSTRRRSGAGPSGSGATRSPSPGADEGDLRPGRREPDGRRPEHRDLVARRPVARPDDDGLGVARRGDHVRVVPSVGRRGRRTEDAGQARDLGHRRPVHPDRAEERVRVRSRVDEHPVGTLPGPVHRLPLAEHAGRGAAVRGHGLEREIRARSR